MMNVIMLSVMAPHQKAPYCSGRLGTTTELRVSFGKTVIMTNVIMLSVMAPHVKHSSGRCVPQHRTKDIFW